MILRQSIARLETQRFETEQHGCAAFRRCATKQASQWMRGRYTYLFLLFLPSGPDGARTPATIVSEAFPMPQRCNGKA